MKQLKILLLIASTIVSIQGATKKEIVAATLILEAGGEKSAKVAMSAVHEVIVNRAKGGDRTKVCLKPKQFSCWNGQNVDAMVAKAKKHSMWNTAVSIVNSPKTNYTKGADHYHTIQCNPSWNRSMTSTTTILNHIFYRA